MIIDLSTPSTTAFANQITTTSLGDHSYIVVVGNEAIAIDIQRDLERFEPILSGIDAYLVAVFETHIHNDYVSGGMRLAHAHGAQYILPANTGATYEHTPLRDGETIPVGGWSIRAMHTPGHTYNHTSYVLESPDGPMAIFSGGSMLVGAVGRSDLLGSDHTDELLESQYESAHRIADDLPDLSIVAPTHGSGSFCSASDVADSTSTIGMERLQNPALTASSFDAFAASQLLGYKQFPVYYKHMAPSNLAPLGAPPDTVLGVVTSLSGIGSAQVVDVRTFDEYASGHLPGSLSVPASTDDAVYMGWTLPWDSPVVLVGTSVEADGVRTHLKRIGWDNVVGRIDPESLEIIATSALATTNKAEFADVGEEPGNVVDVRDPVEHRDGVIRGAKLGHVADIAMHPEAYASDEVILHCQSGYRAAIAAGFLENAGANVTVITDDLGNFKGTLVAPPPGF